MTTTAEASPATASPQSSTQTEEAVGTLRRQIDALDAAIARLIAERAQLSRRVQAVRAEAGGTRVVLSRERAIHQRYRAVLGSAGSAVAEAVLRVCRGSR